MSEPPGGENHGRKRTAEGGWMRLDEDTAQAYDAHLTVDPEPQVYHRPNPPEDTLVHGRVSTYTNHGCRCERCREAQREYVASYRAGRLPEADL